MNVKVKKLKFKGHPCIIKTETADHGLLCVITAACGTNKVKGVLTCAPKLDAVKSQSIKLLKSITCELDRIK